MNVGEYGNAKISNLKFRSNRAEVSHKTADDILILSEHNDKRYKNTELMIHQVMNSALRKRRIGLRIKEVCDEAQITRPTFYLHYTSVDAALRAYEQEIEFELLELLKSQQNREVVFMVMLRYVANHKEYFSAVCGVRNSWILTEVLLAMRSRLAFGIRSDKNYQFYVRSLIAIICLWVDEGCRWEHIDLYLRKLLSTRIMDLGLG